MKHLFLLGFVVLFSCSQTPPEIQAQIDKLKVERQNVKQEVSYLKTERQNLQPTMDSLRGMREELRALEYQKNGGEIEYVLECNLSQDRHGYSADMKDFMNAVDFELVVDRRSYNRYRKGSELLRKSREGSAMTQGTYSDWLITVTGKHINKL